MGGRAPPEQHGLETGCWNSDQSENNIILYIQIKDNFFQDAPCMLKALDLLKMPHQSVVTNSVKVNVVSTAITETKGSVDSIYRPKYHCIICHSHLHSTAQHGHASHGRPQPRTQDGPTLGYNDSIYNIIILTTMHRGKMELHITPRGSCTAYTWSSLQLVRELLIINDVGSPCTGDMH